LTALQLQTFGADEPIALSAVVRIKHEQSDREQLWWLVPEAGGVEIAGWSETVRTLTSVSPLGGALIGLHVGDEGGYKTPRGDRRFEVLEVL
jgi:transcription elongation GreA/GreB family factor